MCVYLRTKFQVSSIILTSFIQEGEVILPKKGTPKEPTQIRVNSHLSEASVIDSKYIKMTEL